MKIHLKITDIDTVNELPSYWNNADYISLLNEMNFPDAESSNPAELKDLVYMALTDFEPNEAAELLLNYKLGETLNEGQIQSVSHEMQNDKIAEEYPDPALHYDLFNINQLLYKAFNGTFPNTEATIIKFDLTTDHEVEMNKEILLKSLGAGLSERSLVHRLFADQLNGEVPFDDGAKVIWKFKKDGDNSYEIITSKYWIEKEDIQQGDYDAVIVFHEEEE